MSYPSNTNMKERGYVPYADFTIAAGGTSNEVDITVQFKESDGTNVADALLFEFWMANEADGSDISDAATAAHADGGAGEVVGALDDDAICKGLTNASGQCVITVTDTEKCADYACVQDPRTGLTNVSRVLATADYA